MKHRNTAAIAALALVVAMTPATAFAVDATSADDLLISEYVEGSSLNKALEIFNGTGEPVDIADYTIEVFFNGSPTAQTTISDMTGTIAPGDVYIVADDGADAEILNVADHTSTSNFWNGDDAVVLTGPSGVVDVIGQVGFDPGSQWGSGAASTQDATLRRMADVCTGDTDPNDPFDPAVEWDGFAQDTFDGLGSHSDDCDGGGDPVVIASDLVDSPVNLVAHDNPHAGAFASAADGFEIYQRGVSSSIPFALLDDSASAFPSDSLGIIGEDETGRFFGATDTENPDNAGPVTATWVFDVSSADGPLFLNVDAGAMGDFEATSDLFEFSVGLDGGSSVPVLTATIDEDASRTYTMDGGASFTLDDPADLEGTPLDNDLTTVSAPIDGSGDTLAVAFTAQTNGGDEAFAFDSLVITQDAPLADEDPEPEPQCDVTPLTLISEVQGDGATSPLAGDTVTVQAVVTLVSPTLGGFFIQEEPEDSDADPATSEGIFVAGAAPASAVAGSTLEATGGVSEEFGRTQVNPTVVAECDRDPAAIDPTPLSLPADTGQRETLEGMVVETAQDLFVSSLFTAYSFGELGVALDGPLTQPTSAFAPDDPQAQQLADANADSLLFINDRDEFGFQNAPWFHDVRRRAGDVVEAGAVGALNFSFGDFLLEPLNEFPEIVQVEQRPAAPTLAKGNDIAAFNVLNYFNTFGDSDVLRGARDQDQFDLQSAKIVEAITQLDAAILGLVELENDYEDHYDGDPSTVPSIQTLVDQLNEEAGPGTYDWIVPDEDDLTTEGLGGGGLGPDAIAQGIIYQPDRVSPVGGPATFDIDAELTGEDTNKNRWPLAQSFEIDRQVVTVVVNHFKSKGSSCEDVGGPTFDIGDDVETFLTGNCNLTREYAAQRLIEWIETKPTGVNSPDTFVIGDLNSYEEEGPIELFIDAGYEDAVQSHGDDAFTFKFDGRYGRLDYVMASPSAKRLLEDAAVWQANSPEPYGYLYFNDPVDTPEAATPYASSDHDPVVVAIDPPR